MAKQAKELEMVTQAKAELEAKSEAKQAELEAKSEAKLDAKYKELRELSLTHQQDKTGLLARNDFIKCKFSIVTQRWVLEMFFLDLWCRMQHSKRVNWKEFRPIKRDQPMVGVPSTVICYSDPPRLTIRFAANVFRAFRSPCFL